MPVHSDPLVKRALWPTLVVVVLAYVAMNFVQHPFLGAPSEAAVTPEAHLTLWLAQTEASGEAASTVRETADSLLLYGRAATVGVLPGGSSQAVLRFLSQPHSADQLLAVSSETVADLAQERTSTLIGENPIGAALAQHLLARMVPVGVLSSDPLTIAVLPDSPIRGVGQLLRELREAPQRNVFAITDGNWVADNLASLVQYAGANGIVPYRVFPSGEEASLELTAGSANVVLAPRGAIQPELMTHALRELPWPAVFGPAPSSWIELLAAPGTTHAQAVRLRRQLLALTHDQVWRARLREYGQTPAGGMRLAQLRSFLSAETAHAAELQQVALRAERY